MIAIKDLKTAKLENLTKVIMRGISPRYVDSGGYLVINQKCIRNNIINLDLARAYDQNQRVKKGCILENGDILINSTGIGTLGRSAMVKKITKNLTIDSHVTLVRPNSKLVDHEFIGFHIELLEPIIENLAGGSTGQTELSRKDVSKLLIVIYDLPTQHRIASILSAYDKLIEVNNQRIKLLEETARELYKEWFVRIRFPATAGRPGYKQAKFVKGVPEGWEIKELHSFGKIYTGKTPPTKIREYYGGEIPFIKTPDLHKNQFIFETEEFLTEKGNNSQKRSTLPKGSICVSCIGTGGIVGISTAEKSQTNQQINSLIPKDKKHLEFLFYAISYLKETIELFGYTGATMTNLSKGKFEKLRILFPGNELVSGYSHIISPMFEQIQILQQQNTHLRQIRDRLLPRLISGKLEVKTRIKNN